MEDTGQNDNTQMENMEKKFLSSLAAIAVFAFSGIGAGAQILSPGKDARTLLKEDLTRCANLHHNYEAPSEIEDTPAPRGYKPLYVSHYGRHGSRYHHSGTYIVRALSSLDSLDAHGLLTDEGKSVLNDIRIVNRAHRGQMGYLTHKGAAQHRGIALRLCDRCPELFRQKDREEVFCASTHVQRCIQSMANFCVALSGRNPNLEITMDAGERFSSYLNNHNGVPPQTRRAKFVIDSVFRANLDPSRVMAAWTTDPEAALGHIRQGDPRKLACDVFTAGTIGQCLDIEDPFIYRHFTFDELYALWVNSDLKYYDTMVGTVENGRGRDIIGARILKDIVERADSALSPGSRRAADLRFGHDTGLSPLLSLLRIRGLEKDRKMIEAPEGAWYGFEFMPMASNLQLIFYRNRGGDTLVKLLHNERETTIPALSPVSGPYYRWSDLRAYFTGLLDSVLPAESSL